MSLMTRYLAGIGCNTPPPIFRFVRNTPSIQFVIPPPSRPSDTVSNTSLHPKTKFDNLKCIFCVFKTENLDNFHLRRGPYRSRDVEGTMWTGIRKIDMECEIEKYETTKSEGNVRITCSGRIRSRFHGEHMIVEETARWVAGRPCRDAVTTATVSVTHPRRSAPTHSDNSHNKLQ